MRANARYIVRRDKFGWSVIDDTTGHVAIYDNVTLTGLAMEEADDLADLLSLLDDRVKNRKPDLAP